MKIKGKMDLNDERKIKWEVGTGSTKGAVRKGTVSQF